MGKECLQNSRGSESDRLVLYIKFYLRKNHASKIHPVLVFVSSVKQKAGARAVVVHCRNRLNGENYLLFIGTELLLWLKILTTRPEAD